MMPQLGDGLLLQVMRDIVVEDDFRSVRCSTLALLRLSARRYYAAHLAMHMWALLT